MMAVPDDLLESTTCDACHKFLSVYPVKEYPCGKIKCGRCSLKNDEGLVCKYSFFDIQGLFKCVNRFDGCRQMLTFPEVRAHENRCTSRIYACPVCPHHPDIPSFFMMKHFRKDHAENVLNTNTFPIDLATIGTTTLLYRLKDNLFFVKHETLSLKTFSLNALFLGNKVCDGLTQNFTVHFEDDKIQTETKPVCIFGDVTNPEAFVMQTPAHRPGLVTVHVDLGDLEVALATKSLDKPTSMVKLPRLVFLLGAYSLKFSFAAASVFAYIHEHSLEFAMHCVACACAVPGPQANFVNTKPGTFQFVCDQCKRYLKQQAPAAMFLLASDAYPGFEQLRLGFACVWSKWGCSEIGQQVETLETHEANCDYQVPQRCPVLGCSYVGKLIDLNAHFVVNHRTDFLFLYKKPLVVETYGSSAPTNYFIWAYYGFVWMELNAGGTKDIFTIGIRQRNALETFGLPKSRLLLVETISGKSVLLKGEMNVSWYVGTQVHVTGYFVEE